MIGVASKQRTSILPDVPTMEEAGLPGYDVRVWYGIFAPSRTPKATIQTLYGQLRTALEAPETRARFAAADSEVVAFPPDVFTREFHAELAKWAKFVKETGLKLQ